MKRMILASHGMLAEGMANTAKMIIGDQVQFTTFSLLPGCHPDQIREQILDLVKKDPQDEFLVVSDLWGGSVNNSLLTLCTCSNVHLVAGMNLNLILQLALNEGCDEQQIRSAIREAREGMVYCNDEFYKAVNDQDFFK